MTVVSVIMPTYHAAKWVATTIDSVIAQTYPHLELIVVDDGSQDDTVSVVGGSSPRTSETTGRLSELRANRVPSAARNVGLTAANGSWVQFLDSDDLIPPTKFERQMAYCARAPDEVTAIYSPWRRCYLDDGNITWEGPLIEPNMEGRAPIMRQEAACALCIRRASLGVRRSNKSAASMILCDFGNARRSPSASQWPADLPRCRRQSPALSPATAPR